MPNLGEGTLDQRIGQLVATRVRLFDAVAAAYRAANAKATTDPIVADRLDFTRDALREQAELQFQTELDVLADHDRTARTTAVELLLSIDSLDGLRRIRGLSVDQTAAVLTDALTALLATPSTDHKEH